ncbi:MAG: flagellar protein FliS [Chitinivibrionales bacterium]
MNNDKHTTRQSAPRIVQQYMRMQVRTANNRKRICMLHDRCAELVSMGIKHSGVERRVLLNKAQNILARLQAALRIDDDVSQGLFYLYDYTYVSLEKGSGSDLVNAYRMLSRLREMFYELQKT